MRDRHREPRARPGDEFASYVAEMLAPLGAVRAARLFSGHGFKIDGVQFAMIIHGVLYLRVDASLADELSALGARPFSYRTTQRTVTVGSYYAVPEDRIDEAEIVLGWARRAVMAARANAERVGTKRVKSGRGSTRKTPRQSDSAA
ncbi:MAG TPA: TfoX/Sxy family protein [Acetobacteraceae bacterium]|nr:TfoX/Sxy family protein [Acetobacteraceae bacterium]